VVAVGHVLLFGTLPTGAATIHPGIAAHGAQQRTPRIDE